jgi:hypothetical protein
MANWAKATKKDAKSISYAAVAAMAVFLTPSAFAQEIIESTPAQAESVESPAIAETNMLWLEAFNASRDQPTSDLFPDESSINWNSANGRWTVRLGHEEVTTRDDLLEGMSVGTYVNFGDIRIGTEIRIPSTDFDFLRPSDNANPKPEIKFESALRF